MDLCQGPDRLALARTTRGARARCDVYIEKKHRHRGHRWREKWEEDAWSAWPPSILGPEAWERVGRGFAIVATQR